MKQFLQLSKCTFFLFTAVSTILLIGLSMILHTPTSSANDSKAPFSISGNLKITHISDGDSLRSGNLRIRLFGIDAPEKKTEMHQPEWSALGLWDCSTKSFKTIGRICAQNILRSNGCRPLFSTFDALLCWENRCCSRTCQGRTGAGLPPIFRTLQQGWKRCQNNQSRNVGWIIYKTMDMAA